MKKISKKVLSILLVACLSVSSVPLSGMTKTSQNYVSALDVTATLTPAPAATKPSVWKSSATSFGINKLYTAGFTFAGSALTTIANSTDSAGFQKTVSILNKYVFGTSGGQTMAEIKQLCNKIIDELQVINQKLDTYTAQMKKMLGEQNYEAKEKNLTDTWDRCVSKFEDDGVENTMDTYKDYIQAAVDYKDGNITESKFNEFKDALYTQFEEIYTLNGGTLSDGEPDDVTNDKIFKNTNVFTVLNDALKSMTKNLNPEKGDSYADAAAQLAYEGLPFASDQYEFVKARIDEQFSEIVLLDMLIQEYLSQQGEYFAEKYSDDETVLSDYEDRVAKYQKYNVTIVEEMTDLLNSDLKVNSVHGIYLKLDEYPKPEDAGTMILKNTDTLESDDNDFVTDQVKFNRVFTLTETGINSFMILDGTQFTSDQLHMGSLIGEKNTSTVWWLFPNNSCKRLLLMDFTDGTNDAYKSIANGSDFTELFNTNAYNLCGSVPVTYLSDYLSYAKNDDIYFMTSTNTTSSISVPYCIIDTYVFQGIYTNKTIIDFGNSDIYKEINFHKICDDDNPFYSVVLVNNQTENGNIVLNQKSSVKVAGEGAADLYMAGKGKESTQVAGSEITIRFKAESNTILNSLVMQRHNDASDKSKTTSETTILEQDDIYSLATNDDGYYEYTLNVPYSDASFILNTQTGKNVYTCGSDGSTDKITLDSYKNVFAEGETVNIIVDEEFSAEEHSAVYIEYSDKKEKLTISEIENGEKVASFTMPNEEVTITYCAHSFNDNGVCIYCGDYQPAVLETLDYDFNDDGKTDENDKAYKISNMGQLYWFAGLVNGTLNDGTSRNTSANAVLTSDIIVNQGVLTSDGSLNTENSSDFTEWTPIGTYTYKYNGTFDGQNHKISGLYFNDSNQSNVGLFGDRNVAKIKNVGIVDSYFNGSYFVGGICGYNSGGTITNCYNSGTVSGDSDYIGGICGYNDKGTITNCYNSGTVSGYSDYIGGICGYNSDTITNCYNSGTVDGYNESNGGICGCNYRNITNCYNTGNVNGNYYVGGICGRNYGDTIINCYNSGTVSGHYKVGGICGYNYEPVTNCYNTGNVNGYDYVGGICGRNDSGKITNCYNSGTAEDSYSGSAYINGNYIGGICGYNENEKGTITNCYYLAKTDDENGGKTTEQFASGEVAYLLSQGCEIDEVTYSGDVWGQTLTGSNKQNYPVLNGKKVLANVDKSKFANDVLIYGQSATLDGTIGVNFYVAADDECTDWTASINGKDVAKPEKDSETGLYKFTYGVAAKNMKDKIQFVINLEGEEKESYDTSVSTYLDALEKDGTGEVKNLAESMETYGNAAEAYFNEKVVDEINDVNELAFANYGFTRDNVSDEIEYYGSSLILETETTIRHYFKLTGDKSIGEFVFKVDGTVAAPTQKGNFYYIDIENISAENLGTSHTVSINEANVITGYSAMSYARAVVESAETTDDLKNLVKALYKYNQSAVTYKGSLSQSEG